MSFKSRKMFFFQSRWYSCVCSPLSYAKFGFWSEIVQPWGVIIFGTGRVNIRLLSGEQSARSSGLTTLFYLELCSPPPACSFFVDLRSLCCT